MEIPPPSFRTPDCSVQCCQCGEKAILYWVQDSVWQSLKAAAQCCGGHVCVECAERFLDRKLTLDDLAIEKYLFTANNERGGPALVIHCVVDVVLGAAIETGVPFPSEWCYMWDGYYNLGKKLASQTTNPKHAVLRLIEQTQQHFPDFTNPYESDWNLGCIES